MAGENSDFSYTGHTATKEMTHLGVCCTTLCHYHLKCCIWFCFVFFNCPPHSCLLVHMCYLSSTVITVAQQPALPLQTAANENAVQQENIAAWRRNDGVKRGSGVVRGEPKLHTATGDKRNNCKSRQSEVQGGKQINDMSAD